MPESKVVTICLTLEMTMKFIRKVKTRQFSINQQRESIFVDKIIGLSDVKDQKELTDRLENQKRVATENNMVDSLENSVNDSDQKSEKDSSMPSQEKNLEISSESRDKMLHKVTQIACVQISKSENEEILPVIEPKPVAIASIPLTTMTIDDHEDPVDPTKHTYKTATQEKFKNLGSESVSSYVASSGDDSLQASSSSDEEYDDKTQPKEAARTKVKRVDIGCNQPEVVKEPPTIQNVRDNKQPARKSDLKVSFGINKEPVMIDISKVDQSKKGKIKSKQPSQAILAKKKQPKVEIVQRSAVEEPIAPKKVILVKPIQNKELDKNPIVIDKTTSLKNKDDLDIQELVRKAQDAPIPLELLLKPTKTSSFTKPDPNPSQTRHTPPHDNDHDTRHIDSRSSPDDASSRRHATVDMPPASRRLEHAVVVIAVATGDAARVDAARDGYLSGLLGVGGDDVGLNKGTQKQIDMTNSVDQKIDQNTLKQISQDKIPDVLERESEKERVQVDPHADPIVLDKNPSLVKGLIEQAYSSEKTKHRSNKASAHKNKNDKVYRIQKMTLDPSPRKETMSKDEIRAIEKSSDQFTDRSKYRSDDSDLPIKPSEISKISTKSKIDPKLTSKHTPQTSKAAGMMPSSRTTGQIAIIVENDKEDSGSSLDESRAIKSRAGIETPGQTSKHVGMEYSNDTLDKLYVRQRDAGHAEAIYDSRIDGGKKSMLTDGDKSLRRDKLAEIIVINNKPVNSKWEKTLGSKNTSPRNKSTANIDKNTDLTRDKKAIVSKGSVPKKNVGLDINDLEAQILDQAMGKVMQIDDAIQGDSNKSSVNNLLGTWSPKPSPIDTSSMRNLGDSVSLIVKPINKPRYIAPPMPNGVVKSFPKNTKEYKNHFTSAGIDSDFDSLRKLVESNLKPSPISQFQKHKTNETTAIKPKPENTGTAKPSDTHHAVSRRNEPLHKAANTAINSSVGMNFQPDGGIRSSLEGSGLKLLNLDDIKKENDLKIHQINQKSEHTRQQDSIDDILAFAPTKDNIKKLREQSYK